MNIYLRENVFLGDVVITQPAEHEEELMKSDFVKLSWDASEKVIIPSDAYIIPYPDDPDRDGNPIKYSLLEPYEPEQKGEDMWHYEPQFQHPKMYLGKICFKHPTKDSDASDIVLLDWSFTGGLDILLQYFCDAINDLFGFEEEDQFVFGVIGDVKNVISVSFSTTDILSALSQCANTLECEWHIDWKNRILYFGHIKIEGAAPLTLKVGENICTPSFRDSREGYWNAFEPQGSTRNITRRAASGEYVQSKVRLALDKNLYPDGIIYSLGEFSDGQIVTYNKDEFEQLGLGVRSYVKSLIFEDIYPRLNLYVYDVRYRERYLLDENTKEKVVDYYDTHNQPVYKRYSVWYIRLAYYNTTATNCLRYPDSEDLPEGVHPGDPVTFTKDGNTFYWHDFRIKDEVAAKVKEVNGNDVTLELPFLPNMFTEPAGVGGYPCVVKHESDEYSVRVFSNDGSCTMADAQLANSSSVGDLIQFLGGVDPTAVSSLYKNSQIIDGKTVMCAFQANTEPGAETSPLAGLGDGDGQGTYGFGVHFHTEDRTIVPESDGDTGVVIKNGDYEIIFQQKDDLVIPTTLSKGLVPKGKSYPSKLGNLVNLYNIAMSPEYESTAQSELEVETKKYITNAFKDNNEYSFKSDVNAFHHSKPDLYIGRSVTYDNAQGYTLDTRIMKLITKIDYDFEVEITVGNEVLKGPQATMKEQVNTLVSFMNAGNMTTSQLQRLMEQWVTPRFLSKLNDDIAQGLITFANGVKFGIQKLFGIDSDGNATLSSVKADTAEIPEFKDDALFDGNVEIIKNITVDGSASIDGYLTAGRGKINSMKSPDYTGDGMADTGWSITNAYNGHSKMTVDELYVRMKAVFEALEVKKRMVTGGDQSWTGASNVIVRTDYLDVSGGMMGYDEVKVPWLIDEASFLLGKDPLDGIYSSLKAVKRSFDTLDPTAVKTVRCYFLAEDADGNKVDNLWMVNDLVRCQTFNLSMQNREGGVQNMNVPSEDGTHVYTRQKNTFWWRKVEAVSSEPVTIDQRKYHYFDVKYDHDAEARGLNTAWCAAGSDIPCAGDDACQFGNTSNPDRMNVISIEVNGSSNADAPCIKGYRGIYTFDLKKCWWGGEACMKMNLSPSRGYKFYGPLFEFITEYGTQKPSMNRGEWYEIPFDNDDYVGSQYPAYSDDTGNYRSDGYGKRHVRKCYYYDQVSINGSIWLCTIANDGFHWRAAEQFTYNGTTYSVGQYVPDGVYDALDEVLKEKCEHVRDYTNEEPSSESSAWTLQVAKGDTGQSSFESIVFKRSDTKPNTPTGGNYTSPVPSGWDGSIPAGDRPIWMSSRIFTDDGLPPQQSQWSDPRLMADTDSFDVEFSPLSPYTTNVPAPTAANTSDGRYTGDKDNIDTSTYKWFDPDLDRDTVNFTNMVWMATRNKIVSSAGVPEWTPWTVVLIKGEDGAVEEARYQWNQSATTPPSYSASSQNPGSNWKTKVPNRPGDGYFLWTISAMRYANGTYGTWGNAIRLTGDTGTPGEDGDEREWIYSYSAEGYDGNKGQVSPSGTAQGNDTNKQQKDWVPNGWRDNPAGVNQTNVIEYASWRDITNSGTTKTYGAFHSPIVWSHYGRNGIDGDGVEYVFIRTTTNTAPTITNSSDTYQSKTYLDDDYLPLSSAGRCTDDPQGTSRTYPYEWVAKRTKGAPDSEGNREWEKYSGTMALWANFSENVVRFDIDNEADMIQTDSALKILSARTVETVARLYDGKTEIDISSASLTVSGNPASSIATITQASEGNGKKGRKISLAFIASKTMASAYEVEISYTYNSVIYNATFTIIASAGQPILQLKPSLSAIPFQRNDDNTLTPASKNVGLSIVRIDGNSTAEYTTASSASVTVRYATSAMPASKTAGEGWSSGNISVANTADNLFIAMFNSDGVLLDRETIPVVKDGANGDNADIPIQLFKWITRGSTISAPTVTKAQWDTGTSQSLGGWSKYAPNKTASDEGKDLYLSQNTIVAGSTLNASAWTTPVRISGEDGDPGADAKEREWIYRGSTTQSAPSGYDSKTGTANGQAVSGKTGDVWNADITDDFVPTSWSDNAIATDGQTNRFVYASWRDWNNTTEKWGNFNTPILWSNWGVQGIDGDGVQYLFRRFTAGKTDSELAALRTELNNNKTFNTTTGEWECANWNDDPTGPDSTNQYEYCAVIKRINGSWGDFDTPSLWAKWSDDGENIIRLDLDNEMDSILYDGTGQTKMSGNVTTTAYLFDGITDVSENATFVISDREGVTASQATISGRVVTVNGLTSDAVVTIRAEYPQNSAKYYYAKFTVKKLLGIDKYDLIVTPNSIGVNTSETVSDKAIGVEVYRTPANGGTRSKVTFTNKTQNEYGLTLEVKDSRGNSLTETTGTSATTTRTFNLTGAMATSADSVSVVLKKNSVTLDTETVPVNHVHNGIDGSGSNAVKIDLDNEMDSIPCDSNGVVMSKTVLTTSARIYDGASPVASGVTVKSIDQIAGVTASSSVSAGVVTVSWTITKGTHLTVDKFTAQIVLTWNGNDYYGMFTATVVKSGQPGVSPTIYQLSPNPSVIAFALGSDGKLPSAPQTLEMKIKETTGTSTRIIEMSQSGLTVLYRKDQMPTSSTDSQATAFPAAGLSVYTSDNNIYVAAFSGTTLIDREVVPVVKDGETGDAGENVVALDIDNEMDTVQTDSAGKILANTTITTIARIYDGASEVDISGTDVSVSGSPSTSIATFSQASEGSGKKGRKLQWVFQANQTMASKYDISISKTYGDSTYKAAFTVTASKGLAVYQLKPSLSAVKFAAGDTTAKTLTVKVVKTDSGTVTETNITNSGQGVYYKYDTMPTWSSKGTAFPDAGISVSSDKTNVYIAMFNSSGTLLDRETIPVVKDGAPGEPGDDAFGLTLNPEYAIFEEVWDGNEGSNSMTVDLSGYVGKVRVLEGSTAKAFKITYGTHDGCSLDTANSTPANTSVTEATIRFGGIATDSNGYVKQGYLLLNIVTTDNNYSYPNVKIPFYLNKMGTFDRKITNGVETAIGLLEEYYPTDGSVPQHSTWMYEQINSAQASITTLSKTVENGKNILDGVLTGSGWKSAASVSAASSSMHNVTVDSDGYFNKFSGDTYIIKTVRIERGRQYMMSFYTDSSVGVTWGVYNSNGTQNYNGGQILPGTERRSFGVYVSGTDRETIRICISVARLRYPQLELGTSVTAFEAPTIETSSQIRQTADDIELQVSNVEGDVSTLSVTVNGITGQVSNLAGDVATLSLRADGLTSTVTKGKNILSGVLTGENWNSASRNVQAGGMSFSALKGVEDYWFIRGNLTTYIASPLVAITEGKTYTLSFDAEGTTAVKVIMYISSSTSETLTTSATSRRSVTFESGYTGNVRFLFQVAKIRYPQLELGDAATTFDTSAEETSSCISQTADEIDLSITNKLGETGINIDGNNREINLIAGKVNFKDSTGATSPYMSIDNDGKLIVDSVQATNGDFSGQVTVSSLYHKITDITASTTLSGENIKDTFRCAASSEITITLSGLQQSGYEGIELTFINTSENRVKLAGNYFCFTRINNNQFQPYYTPSYVYIPAVSPPVKVQLVANNLKGWGYTWYVVSGIVSTY